jgi:hypothetical protein
MQLVPPSIHPGWALAAALLSTIGGALTIWKILLELKKMRQPDAPSAATNKQLAPRPANASLFRQRPRYMALLIGLPWVGLSIAAGGWVHNYLAAQAWKEAGQQQSRAQQALLEEFGPSRDCTVTAAFSSHDRVTIPLRKCRALGGGRLRAHFKFVVNEVTSDVPTDDFLPTWRFGLETCPRTERTTEFGITRTTQQHDGEIELDYFDGGDAAPYVELLTCNRAHPQDACQGSVKVIIQVDLSGRGYTGWLPVR